MEFGRICVWVGFGTSILTVIAYLASLRAKRALPIARFMLAISSAASVAAFARLMWLVVNHKFQFNYVFDYVSSDLHGAFLYSATWAGQEGSFLLWSVWTAIIGLLIAWKAGKWEPRVLPFFMIAQVFLFAILNWLSPFAMLQRGGSAYPMEAPWPPVEGQGLNPSLQNIWMAIHPPTIFFGFVGLAVPFAYALAALVWKEYEEWSIRVLPWVLLTVSTLGVGLFMGGYWAYETQGWHGFWAWDPVENASLFPWMASLALLHGLIVNRDRGGMSRTNLLMAIAGWVLFVYGTYLTRSGVLSNVSVHAFSTLDQTALKLLLWMIGVSTVGSLSLLIARFRTIPGKSLGDNLVSRDSAMVAAVTLMILCAVIVAIGTSWSMISRMPWLANLPGLAAVTSKEGVRAEPIFYNRIGSALLIPGLIVMALAPYLPWGKGNPEKMVWSILAPWLLSITGGFGVLWYIYSQTSTGFTADTPRMLVIAIATLGLFAALTNLKFGLKVLKLKGVHAGGWLAHVGIGLLFVGTVITNVYERTHEYTLVENQPPVETPFGVNLALAGWTHDGKPQDKVMADWWKFDHAARIDVKPAGGGAGYRAEVPVFYNKQRMMSAGDDGPQTMRWPNIKRYAQKDIYIEVASDPHLVRPIARLKPGETATIGIGGQEPTGYEVKYLRYKRVGSGMEAGTEMVCEMELITPDGKHIPITPGIRLGREGMERINLEIPGMRGAAMIEGGIDSTSRETTVAFELPEHPAVWVVPIAITNKPMINLVWLGVVLMTLGGLISMVRRAREARAARLDRPAAA